MGRGGAAATPRPWSPGGAGQGLAQGGAPPRRQHYGDEVRRYVGFAFIGAIAFIAGVGIGYPSFHNDSRRSPVMSSTEDRSGDDRVACQVEGQDLVSVPYLIGKHLLDAAARARASGLQLVGTGVSGGDPAGASATVVAQAPPADIRVPAGACIGFRTRP